MSGDIEELRAGLSECVSRMQSLNLALAASELGAVSAFLQQKWNATSDFEMQSTLATVNELANLSDRLSSLQAHVCFTLELKAASL